MPSKPYYEIPAPKAFLDEIRADSGLPDNFIEDATRGTPEGTPEPGSAEVQEFFKAALDAVRQRPETSAPGEDQGEGQGPDPTPPQPSA